MMATDKRRTQAHGIVVELEVSVVLFSEWRCVCGAFLVAYDPTYPCVLQRKCPRCKRENMLDNRHAG